MTNTILLAGATGMFGSRIAHHLLGERPTRPRPPVGSKCSRATKDKLEAPRQRQAPKLIEGRSRRLRPRSTGRRAALTSSSPLSKAARTLSSTAKSRWRKAGKANGVRRILPSDYALDLFKATPGEHAMFDMRGRG